MRKYFHIDIVLPCFNPEPNWIEQVSLKYQEIKKSFKYLKFHLYIVNDGSSFGFKTKNIENIKQLIPKTQIISYKTNKGKGYALRQAVKICTSPYIIYTDYDFPYTNKSYCNVLLALKKGADIVIAVRDKQYQHNLPFLRKCLSYASQICNTWLLGMKFHDTQGGLKGFNQNGRKVFLSTNIDTYLFDMEFIYRASQHKEIKISEVPASIRSEIKTPNMKFQTYWHEIKVFYYYLITII